MDIITLEKVTLLKPNKYSKQKIITKSECLRSNKLRQGWDKTIFLGRDRDQEIRLIQTHYEKKWMLIFCVRRDQGQKTSKNFVRLERDRKSRYLSLSAETRPRLSFFTGSAHVMEFLGCLLFEVVFLMGASSFLRSSYILRLF